MPTFPTRGLPSHLAGAVLEPRIQSHISKGTRSSQVVDWTRFTGMRSPSVMRASSVWHAAGLLGQDLVNTVAMGATQCQTL